MCDTARADFLSRGMLTGTCLGGVLQVLQDAIDEDDPSGLDIDPNSDQDDVDECGPVDGPPILSEVKLCSKKGTSVITYSEPTLTHYQRPNIPQRLWN
jgi:hypothetical protein